MQTATLTTWRALGLGLAIAGAGAGVVWFGRSQHAAEDSAPERRMSDPYRLEVKLTTDAEAGAIVTKPVDSTLPRLLQMPRGRGAGREAPLERQIWRVEARITAVRFRPDGDVVLDISAEGAKTTAELPDPALCKGSPFRGEIAAARGLVSEGKSDLVGHEVTLCGVGFRGLPSPSNRSGVRIYPLLAVSIGTAR